MFPKVTPQDRVALQNWVNDTKPLIGQSKAKQSSTSAFDPNQDQIDDRMASIQELKAKAQPKAGQPGEREDEERFPAESLESVADTSAPVKQPMPEPPKPRQPNVPSFDPEKLKERWKTTTLQPAQQQIDAKVDSASKAMMAKAQQMAGPAGAGLVADEFTHLKKQFATEALESYPDRDKVGKLMAAFAGRIDAVTRNVGALLQDGKQLQQKLNDREQCKDLRRQWERKVKGPLDALPDSQVAIKEKCLAEGKRFEAALSAGRPAEAERIYDNVFSVVLPKALAEYKLEQDKEAYLTQMMKQASAEFNPNNKFDPKKLEMWGEITRDLTDHTGNGLSKAEVLAVRVYTASNYKYINPAVANQKDRPKDRKTDWMDNSHKPDPSQAEAILQEEAAKRGWRPPTPAEIEAKRRELEQKLKEYEEAGKQTLYEEGALHAGMMLEAFKKLPPERGEVYRGARMNQEMFNREYSKGKVITYESFASSATDPHTARNFANGLDGANPDQTISVYAIAVVFDARNIKKLSVVPKENEWLISPGTQLRVDRIEDDLEQHPGLGNAPPATVWKKVFLTQVRENS